MPIVPIPSTFSKVLEKAIELQLSPFLEDKFSKFLCANRKQFSSQHALFRLELARNKHIGAVLIDLSKTFDCLPKIQLLAKLHAYGVDRNSLLLIQNYMSNRKQRVKVTAPGVNLDKECHRDQYLDLYFSRIS